MSLTSSSCGSEATKLARGSAVGSCAVEVASGWYAAYFVARQDGMTPEEAASEGKLRIEGTR